MLGGSSPLAAAEYQLAIFWLISGTVAFSTYVGVGLAVRNAIFDQNHRLTQNKIMTKEKLDTISAMVENMKTCFACLFYRRQQQVESLAAASMSSYELVHTVDSSLHVSSAQNVDLTQAPQRNGRVSYSIISSQTSSVNTSDIFEISGINVLSGDRYLFNSNGLHIKIKAGERVCIEGVSGIGKTRLLRAISNLDVIPDGYCRFFDANNLVDNSEWRCRCIYVPQALPPLSGSPSRFIDESCSYSSRKRLLSRSLTENELTSQLRQTEILLGLPPNKFDQTWGSFSGGERQRAAIGVALILSSILTSSSNQASVLDNPGSVVLLLDEPTSACDKLTVLRVEDALRAAGVTIVMITHDNEQAIRFATRRIVFKPLEFEGADV